MSVASEWIWDGVIPDTPWMQHAAWLAELADWRQPVSLGGVSPAPSRS
jgi:hypothetical protein